jgi:hypothetical protein
MSQYIKAEWIFQGLAILSLLNGEFWRNGGIVIALSRDPPSPKKAFSRNKKKPYEFWVYNVIFLELKHGFCSTLGFYYRWRRERLNSMGLGSSSFPSSLLQTSKIF